MGEDADDVQKLKRAAAAAFDYEGDPRWSKYWSNILIPPHMASRSDVVDHFRRKFYQLYIDPGIVVEPISMSNCCSPTRQPMSPSPTLSLSAGEARARSMGSTSNKSAQSAGTLVPSAIPRRWNRQTLLFSVDVWVSVLALLAIFPLVPRNLATKAYFLSFIGTACSSVFSLYSQNGTPRAWNLHALELWFNPILPSKDFVYIIYSLIFVTSKKSYLKCEHPLMLTYLNIFHLTDGFFFLIATHVDVLILLCAAALVPVLCRALEHVAKFMRSNFHHSILYRKFLEKPCVWVDTNSSTLTILSSNAEVALGFLLILSLFSWQRNIVVTFMYWQLLKFMYHIPATAADHHSVWTNIGRAVRPATHRYAPFLRTPISIAQRWWSR